MSEEQKDDALVFLKCSTEELAGLPNGQGMQAVANFRTLLDYLVRGAVTVSARMRDAVTGRLAELPPLPSRQTI